MSKKLPENLSKKLADSQAGQALLIVLLVMSVVLTIGLSVASRSVTDVQISTKEDDALRAFSAAEAGIEQSLITSRNITDQLDSGAKFSSEIEKVEGVSEFAYPTSLKSGDSATFWFVDTNGANPYRGDVQFCWGNRNSQESQESPSVEITVYYKDAGGNVSVKRYAYGDEPGFAQPSSDNCQINDIEKKQVSFKYNTQNVNINGAQFARVRIFNSNSSEEHPVGIKALQGVLPLQGVFVVSTGQAGDATRKIKVFRSRSDLPSIFDYTLFSGSGSYK